MTEEQPIKLQQQTDLTEGKNNIAEENVVKNNSDITSEPDNGNIVSDDQGESLAEITESQSESSDDLQRHLQKESLQRKELEERLAALEAQRTSSVESDALVAPFKTRWFAYLMIATMVVGALMILLGIYAQIAGLILMIYCLVGIVVHYRLGRSLLSKKLSATARTQDKQILNKVAKLGFIGHFASAQKNLALAAVAFFIMLLGSGPLSLTLNIW